MKHPLRELSGRLLEQNDCARPDGTGPTRVNELIADLPDRREALRVRSSSLPSQHPFDDRDTQTQRQRVATPGRGAPGAMRTLRTPSRARLGLLPNHFPLSC